MSVGVPPLIRPAPLALEEEEEEEEEEEVVEEEAEEEAGQEAEIFLAGGAVA